MNRRFLPCGLGWGGHRVGGHLRGPAGPSEVVVWPFLGGFWVSQCWTSGRLSLLRLQPVFCAGGPGPRFTPSVRIRLCFIRLSPLSGSVPERVWCLALILAGSEACGWLLLACLACLMHSLVFPPWVGPLRLGPTSPRIAGGQTLPFVFVIITRVSRHGISARSIARTPIYRTHTTSLVRLLGGRC